MSLPCLRDARAYCFFFDFDGTLTELAETPGAVRLHDETRQALKALSDATSGAVAIVTGREIETVDRFTAPLKLPASGVHGFERRNGHGLTILAAARPGAAEIVAEGLRAYAAQMPGLLLEEKRGAIALHYRQRAELEADCLLQMEAAVAPLSDVVLTRGKMVIEARFHRATKGDAIQDFLSEAPFQGRIPLFAGDDATDEDAFEIVNKLGGVSIKVGPGETAARARAQTVGEFLSWLAMIASTLNGSISHE